MGISIQTRRWRQQFTSIPHYLHELRHLRTLHEAREWLYYKSPYLFPLNDYPVRITLEPTNECNFACPHCPRNVINAGRSIGFMPYDLFVDIIKEVAASRPTLKLAGLGEPALHPDLGRMMSILRDNRLPTYLYTNGTLFEKWSHKEILDWNFQTLVVSIDGTDEQSFERLRKGGKYWHTRSAVKAFRSSRDESSSRRPEIEIRHVIMPTESTVELKEFRRDWLKLGDTVKFNYFNPPKEQHRAEDPQRPRCRDIRREFYIRVDGRVPLCAIHDEWLGSVKNTPVAQLWHHSRLKEVRQCHETRDFSTVPFCKTCPFR